jgi:type IX secretion system PorP/SprF family membrane protein
MLRYLYGTIVGLIMLTLSPALRAQDARFTQFYASPQTLSPALTGLFSGRYRMVVNHRSQWWQALDEGFTTAAFAADLHYDLRPGRRDSDSFGGGVLFMTDRTGTGGIASNQIMISGAFHKVLDRDGEQRLSAGIQFGIVQRSVSFGTLTFQDAFNGTTAFIPGQSGENLPAGNVAFPDGQLGLNYSLSPRRGFGLNLGAAIHHLTGPEQSFYADDTAGRPVEVSNTLNRRYSLYGSFSLPLGRNGELSPRGYLLVQGPHNQVNLGINYRVLLGDYSESALHFGAYAQVLDEVTGPRPTTLGPALGLELGEFLFGLSYDISVKTTLADEPRRGTLEFSVAYTGRSEADEAVPCPTF